MRVLIVIPYSDPCQPLGEREIQCNMMALPLHERDHPHVLWILREVLSVDEVLKNALVAGEPWDAVHVLGLCSEPAPLDLDLLVILVVEENAGEADVVGVTPGFEDIDSQPITLDLSNVNSRISGKVAYVFIEKLLLHLEICILLLLSDLLIQLLQLLLLPLNLSLSRAKTSTNKQYFPTLAYYKPASRMSSAGNL